MQSRKRFLELVYFKFFCLSWDFLIPVLMREFPLWKQCLSSRHQTAFKSLFISYFCCLFSFDLWAREKKKSTQREWGQLDREGCVTRQPWLHNGREADIYWPCTTCQTPLEVSTCGSRSFLSSLSSDNACIVWWIQTGWKLEA